MGQTKKIIHEYNGILMDSGEEVWMAMYLEVLKNTGYVDRWVKVTRSIEIFPDETYSYTKTTALKTKTKVESKSFTFLKGLSYTPDFAVNWNEKRMLKFVSHIGTELNTKSWFFAKPGTNQTFIEVKPNFDQNGKTAKFSIIQKILWNTKKIFVDLILPEKLFEGTFMPVEAMGDFKYKKSPTGKNKGKKTVGDWKTDYLPKTFEQYVRENNSK